MSYACRRLTSQLRGQKLGAVNYSDRRPNRALANQTTAAFAIEARLSGMLMAN
jgi:hypothetical protein